MNRRNFLGTIPLIIAIAGCASGSDTNTPSEKIDTSKQTQTRTRANTPTDTPTETPNDTPIRTPEEPNIDPVTVSATDLTDNGTIYKIEVGFNSNTQNSADPDSMTGGYRSSDGEKLVLVRATVNNIGNENIDLVSAIFALRTTNQTHPFNIPLGDQQLGGTLLESGESDDGWLITTVPDSVTEATLIAEKNQFYRANYESSLHVGFEKDESIDASMPEM